MNVLVLVDGVKMEGMQVALAGKTVRNKYRQLGTSFIAPSMNVLGKMESAHMYVV